MGANGVRLGAEGRLEVVRSSPPEDATALRAVVARLRAAAGPGVVQVVAHHDDGERIEVVLAFAGRPPIAPMPGRELAPVAAAVASHLADLHLRGLAHGALCAEHVLVDAAGAVRLCGLADGDQDGDVVALGRLLDDLLDPEDDHPALRSVVARCAVDDAAARPTMAAIAAALATASPRAVRAAPDSVEGERRRLPLVVGAVVTALACLVAVASVSRAEPRRDEPAPTTTITSTSTSAVGARRVWPPNPPRTIEHDGATWTFGADDDRALLVGDWSCTGTATPLLLDASGNLYVVDEWTDELAARLVGTFPDATSAAVEHGQSCDVVVLTTPDGEVRPTVRA